MTIPSEVLEAMPPVAFDDLRKSLKGGDVVLCQGSDPFSRLIQWSTGSLWSHVGLVFSHEDLDQVIVIEAVEKIGVRAVALADFVSRDSEGKHPYPGKILFARHKRIEGAPGDLCVRRMAKFAFEKLGSKFAAGEIVKIAMRIADARLFGNRKTPQLLEADDEYICSEFVAEAYRAGGISIPWDGLGFIAPSDFAEDPDLEPLAQADVRHPPLALGRKRKVDGTVDPASSRSATAKRRSSAKDGASSQT